MQFELLDEYLLTGSPPKAAVVEALLAQRSTIASAAPFYEGMRMLGARTPDLALVALRLVVAGKRADDASVVALRDQAERARAGGADAAAAREAYVRALAALALCVLSVFVASPAPAQQQTATPNLYRTLESDHPAHPAAEIRGFIEKIDYPGTTLIVRTGAATKVVAILPATTIYQRGGYATFAALRRGQRVVISVYEVGGRLIAQTIRI
ncbi:MAG TPA: hypothetical protein VMD47_11125 [Candidatus Acidoferrales bacterium]|nr:hypothetical protein [Candidatus Acidoferrales bacterium]